MGQNTFPASNPFGGPSASRPSPGLEALRKLGASQPPPFISEDLKPPPPAPPDNSIHAGQPFDEMGDPQMPGLQAPGPPTDFSAFRRWAEGKMGTDPGTPVDTALRVPEEILGHNPFSGMFDSLNKDPHAGPAGATAAKPPTITNALPDTGGGLPTSQVPPLGPNQFMLPSGTDETKNVVGTASYGGVKGDLNNEAALSGLKSNAPKPGFQPSQGELFQLAGRDPATVAPGSTQMWQHQLGESIDDEKAQSDLALKQQTAIAGGITNQNPAIQTGLQQQAERAPGGIGVAKIQADASTAANTNRLEALQGFLTMPGASERSFNLGGGVSVGAGRPQQNIPPQLSAQLTRDRANAAAQGGKDTFGRPTPAGAALASTIQSVIQAFPGNPDIKDLVRVIIADPQASKAPTSQAALQLLASTHGLNLQALTPEELQQIDQLYSLVKP